MVVQYLDMFCQYSGKGADLVKTPRNTKVRSPQHNLISLNSIQLALKGKSSTFVSTQ